MKKCKSCKKEIDDSATKCPFCQSFQKWYKGPQIMILIFPLLMLPSLFSISRLTNDEKYLNYKKDILVTQVNIASDTESDIHTYNIKNNTEHKWHDISYQFIGTDEEGKVVVVQSDSKYRWKVQANSASMISIKTPKDTPAEKWSLKIVDMKFDKY